MAQVRHAWPPARRWGGRGTARLDALCAPKWQKSRSPASPVAPCRDDREPHGQRLGARLSLRHTPCPSLTCGGAACRARDRHVERDRRPPAADERPGPRRAGRRGGRGRRSAAGPGRRGRRVWRCGCAGPRRRRAARLGTRRCWLVRVRVTLCCGLSCARRGCVGRRTGARPARLQALRTASTALQRVSR